MSLTKIIDGILIVNIDNAILIKKATQENIIATNNAWQ